MNILHEIKEHKIQEVAERKSKFPVALLEDSIHFDAPCVAMTQYVTREDKSGIIAEFKRRSPSKPKINMYADVEKVSLGYMQAGASALSVLTDEHFFGGSNADLITARKFNYCPILRKDFIIDTYQIHEAKSIGTDVILLIAAILDSNQIQEFTSLAHELGMQVLTEIHAPAEMQKIKSAPDLIGVNNRNLETFTVDHRHSIDLLPDLPADSVKISESGISDPAVVNQLREAGYDGFLIGERFMSHPDPGKACRKFIRRL